MKADEIVKKLMELGELRLDSDLNEEELLLYIEDLKETIEYIPDDEPEVKANFVEDLEDAYLLLKKFKK